MQEFLSAWIWPATLPGHKYIHPPGSSPNSVLLGFYRAFLMQAPSITDSISSPSSLSGELGGRVGNSKVVSGDQLPSRSHPESPPQNKRCSQCLYHLGNHKGFRSSVPEGRGSLEVDYHTLPNLTNPRRHVYYFYPPFTAKETEK